MSDSFTPNAGLHPSVYLAVEAHDLDLEVYLNDIPILRQRDGKHYRATEAANSWLRPSGNRLRVFGRWPDSVPYAAGKAGLVADLYLCAPNVEFPTPLRSLAAVRWPLPGGAERFPFTVEVSSRQDGFPTLKLWSETQPLTALTFVDREQILRELAALREAVLAGDVERLMEHHALKIDDLAASEGKERARLEVSMRKQFEWLTQLPGLAEAKIDPTEIVLRLVGDGHVTQVITRTGASPLAFIDASGDVVVGFEPLYGKVNGRWRLVR